MVFTFPIVFGSDAPGIVLLDISGNELDDTLDENTYASFGTIPKGSSSTLTLLVKNTGRSPVYSAKIEGLASSHQLGEAAHTYEALGLPEELGSIMGLEEKEFTVTWTVPSTSPTGMKIFAVRATDSNYFNIVENHNYFSKITITNNDTDLLLDFPIEINFTVGSIDWTKTTSDGRDLRFYDTDFNLLNHYVDTWTPGTTTGKVYVRVPKIEGKATEYIYLGYGKFDLFSLSEIHGKYDVYEDFNNGFNESWVAYLSNYDFTTDVGCITIKSELNSSFTTPTLVLALPTIIKDSCIIEFAAKYATLGNPISTNCGVCLTLLNNLSTVFIPDTRTGTNPLRLYSVAQVGSGTYYQYVGSSYAGTNTSLREFKIILDKNSVYTYYPPTTLVQTTTTEKSVCSHIVLAGASVSATIGYRLAVDYIRIYRYLVTTPTISFADVADITAEFINPDVDSGIVCVIGNVVRQLAFHDYDFKKIIYEVGYNNAYWRVPGTSGGIYVWGKLEMRPLYGEDVSFVDNLYANDAYFYTFTDYGYDVHDKLDVEGVLYDIQAIQVHDAGRETIYKTLVLKRQPEYYACCVGIVG